MSINDKQFQCIDEGPEMEAGLGIPEENLMCGPILHECVLQAELSAAPRCWETVLLVEDDEAVRTIMCRILETCGYRLLVAETAEEAMQLFENHEDEVQVLVADLNLSGMGGRQLARQLMDRSNVLKTVFVSGYDSSMVGNDWDRNCAYLQKPFTLQTLATTVREVIDGTRYPKENEWVN